MYCLHLNTGPVYILDESHLRGICGICNMSWMLFLLLFCLPQKAAQLYNTGSKRSQQRGPTWCLVTWKDFQQLKVSTALRSSDGVHPRKGSNQKNYPHLVLQLKETLIQYFTHFLVSHRTKYNLWYSVHGEPRTKHFHHYLKKLFKMPSYKQHKIVCLPIQ